MRRRALWAGGTNYLHSDFVTQQLPERWVLQALMAPPSAALIVEFPHDAPQACVSPPPAVEFETANALCFALDFHVWYSFLQFLFQSSMPWAEAGAFDNSTTVEIRVKIRAILANCESQFVQFIGCPPYTFGLHVKQRISSGQADTLSRRILHC